MRSIQEPVRRLSGANSMSNEREFLERIERVARLLCDRGVATEDTLLGCTTAQIDEVEADVGVPLPIVYREFLARMGCGAGRFYVGTDIQYPALLGLTQAARELIGEDEAEIRLPEDAVVILMHQGYQFMFVRSGEGDDPPVYYYMERTGRFDRMADSLSRFLFDAGSDDW